MSKSLKAIETRYAGCRFRSRLEARWAVFFDRMEIEWQYEPEGFETPSGRYLPDFYLPDIGRWVEIKGGSFTKRDRDRAAHFAEARWQLGEGFRLLRGDVPRRAQIGPYGRALLRIVIWGHAALPILPKPEDVFLANQLPQDKNEWSPVAGYPIGAMADYEGFRDFIDSAWLLAAEVSEVDAALTAARSARFEHGECG